MTIYGNRNVTGCSWKHSHMNAYWFHGNTTAWYDDIWYDMFTVYHGNTSVWHGILIGIAFDVLYFHYIMNFKEYFNYKHILSQILELHCGSNDWWCHFTYIRNIHWMKISIIMWSPWQHIRPHLHTMEYRYNIELNIKRFTVLLWLSYDVFHVHTTLLYKGSQCCSH